MVVVEAATDQVLAGRAEVPLAPVPNLQVPNLFPTVVDARIPPNQRVAESPILCLNQPCLPAGKQVVARGLKSMDLIIMGRVTLMEAMGTGYRNDLYLIPFGLFPFTRMVNMGPKSMDLLTIAHARVEA